MKFARVLEWIYVGADFGGIGATVSSPVARGQDVKEAVEKLAYTLRMAAAECREYLTYLEGQEK